MNYFRKPDSLVDAVKTVISEKPLDPTNPEVEELEERVNADEYHSTSEKSQFGGHRPKVVNKKTGKTMFLGSDSYKKPEHAKGHADAYLKGYAANGEGGADRSSSFYRKSNAAHLYQKNESVDLDTDNVNQALKHDCATHVVHEQYGEGRCIPGMHTLIQIDESEAIVTHYDVMFEGAEGPFVVEGVPVTEMKVVKSEAHTHGKKKMAEENIEEASQMDKIRADAERRAGSVIKPKEKSKTSTQTSMDKIRGDAEKRRTNEETELEEGRGRPRKNPNDPKWKKKSSGDDGEHDYGGVDSGKEPDEHLHVQLKKAQDSTMKPFEVKFDGGKKHPVPHHQAATVLKHLDRLKPNDRQKVIDHMSKSPAHFKQVHDHLARAK